MGENKSQGRRTADLRIFMSCPNSNQSDISYFVRLHNFKMKFTPSILLFPISFFSISCTQHTAKERSTPVEYPLPGKVHYVIDTLDIPGLYIVKSDRSWF